MAMIYNLGSINIDHRYRMASFVRPGETLICDDYQQFAGGKGLNQSIALARAGAQVAHVGACGPDARLCLDMLYQAGANLDFVNTDAQVSGHAVISVDDAGENQIVVVPGANHQIPQKQMASALDQTQPGDWWVMQNETNGQIECARAAQAKQARVAYSAAPFDATAVKALLLQLDLLAVNQVEAEQVQQLLNAPPEDWGVQVLITLGARGAKFWDGRQWFQQSAPTVEAVDTTGAGDTFFGFFSAALERQGPQEALALASRAAAIQVTRHGAADAIPTWQECQ